MAISQINSYNLISHYPNNRTIERRKARLEGEDTPGMKPSIIDTHAHLDAEAFNEDRAGVIARALDSGISTIVTVGVGLESSKSAIELAEKHTEVFATTGFHPHDASRMREEDVDKLAETADHPRMVAIGEAGLDFYRNYSPREAQLQALHWQLELAAELDMPIIIHCRQAEKDMLAVLHDWTSHHKELKGRPRGVIHCFNGNTNTAQQYLDMGFFISLGGYITYPSSRPMYDAIRSIPRDRLVVETDCPFLSPQSHRGQRNEPAYLPLTVELLAEIRQVSPETVARETTENARYLFQL